MQTRSGPVPHVLNQPRANRIAKRVVEDREEMAVLLNRKTFEAALPHMPMAAVRVKYPEDCLFERGKKCTKPAAADAKAARSWTEARAYRAHIQSQNLLDFPDHTEQRQERSTGE